MASEQATKDIKQLGLKLLMSKLSLSHPVAGIIAAAVLAVTGGTVQQQNVQSQVEQNDRADSIAYLLIDVMQTNEELKARLKKVEKESTP